MELIPRQRPIYDLYPLMDCLGDANSDGAITCGWRFRGGCRNLVGTKEPGQQMTMKLIFLLQKIEISKLKFLSDFEHGTAGNMPTKPHSF